MKCPHCLVEINPNFSEFFLGPDKDTSWSIYRMICPNTNCGKMIVQLACGEREKHHQGGFYDTLDLGLISMRVNVHPLTSGRSPVPKEVESVYANDYSEACLIYTFSPKASAALSRRCLQSILRDKSGVKKGDLANEIQQVIDSKTLPSHLADSIDAIRNIGNFAVHPLKSTSSGEIVEVELGEAEWLLDVLEALFDFYFVQPAILKAKKEALNAKLKDLGKPEMK